MNFFVTATLLTTEGIDTYSDQESAALAALRQEGVVSAAYREVESGRVIGIVHGEDLADAEAKLATLPFVAHGIMRFDFTEVVPM